MSSERHFAWVLGWAICPRRFAALAQAAFPADRHTLVEAGPDWATSLAAAGRPNWTIGYSLGSLLLLREPPTSRVALLAPIWAFPAEAGAGGRFPRAAVRALARQLRQDASSAVAHFGRLAGVEDLVSADHPEALRWGLEQLETQSVPPVLPPAWLGLAGANDPLLDHPSVQAQVRGLSTVPGAGHHPGALLPELRRRINAGQQSTRDPFEVRA